MNISSVNTSIISTNNLLNNNMQLNATREESNGDLSITLLSQEQEKDILAPHKQPPNGLAMHEEDVDMELLISVSPYKKSQQNKENQSEILAGDKAATTALEQKSSNNDEENSVQNRFAEISLHVTEDSLLQDDHSYFQHALIELGRRLWQSEPQVQRYTKGCIWSPDGTCLLVPVHLDGMHVIELPTDLYNEAAITKERDLSKLESAVHVKEGGTVYDVSWYPFMNSNAPETCCWLATRQHEPIHMWDAFNGELRCSYRGYDDFDEVETAISITFSNDGQNVIAGYKKTIKIFDTNIPGRDCSSIPVKQAISCFATTTSNDNTVTAGTWNGYIQHYDLRTPKLGPLFTLGGHVGGITLLRYYPTEDDNWMLFSGARKDNKILLWDMRNYTKPVNEFHRTVKTNQRVYFDLSPQLQWLVSGDTEGNLLAWDLLGENEDIKLQIHDDCCNGASFHPTQPILATSSGQYHFVDVTHDEEKVRQQPQQVEEKIIDYENALLLLWCGPHSNK